MNMTVKRRQPYVWVTWLSKVMAGEQACLWASWFKAHHQDYPKIEGNFDLARWNLEHTRLLVQTRSQLNGRWAEVRVESQNAFRYRHASGALLAGKPDIIAWENGQAVVMDCKTGRPKMSDLLQVQIYMQVVPQCVPELRDCTMHGRVVYAEHARDIPPEAVDARFGELVDYFLNLIASEFPPCKAPSTRECLFCDITESDCPSRLTLSQGRFSR
jgi:hypothetical protein